MYDHHRDTADTPDTEDKESVSLWAKRGCGHWDFLSAGVQDAIQKETGLGRTAYI